MRRSIAPKLGLTLYLILLMLPVYWLINMSLRTNSDISVRTRALAASPDARKIHRHIPRPDLGPRPLASR